jgi:hypothetical protein
MNNKIAKITNFDTLIDQIKSDMKKISQFNIGICEDVFFWGSHKNTNESKISYKIADFDTITINKKKKIHKTLTLTNIQAMFSSLLEYVNHFVEDSSLKECYQNCLKKEINI